MKPRVKPKVPQKGEVRRCDYVHCKHTEYTVRRNGQRFCDARCRAAQWQIDKQPVRLTIQEFRKLSRPAQAIIREMLRKKGHRIPE